MRLHVIKETLQGNETAGAPQQAAMHADRQHLGLVFALGIQDVETVFQILIKMPGGVEALWRGKAHIVSVERVGHHQVRFAAAIGQCNLGPEGQIVAVIIRVVSQSAVFDHQLPGIG